MKISVIALGKLVHHDGQNGISCGGMKTKRAQDLLADPLGLRASRRKEHEKRPRVVDAVLNFNSVLLAAVFALSPARKSASLDNSRHLCGDLCISFVIGNKEIVSLVRHGDALPTLFSHHIVAQFWENVKNIMEIMRAPKILSLFIDIF